jgi:tetratricopeptide (TPR) repeat protein
MVDNVLRYKLAWTYYKEQRYREAARAFASVLELHAGKDFDDEARTYLAGSLVEPDFIGPGPDEPYIPRASVMDTEHDPRIVQKKMAVGLSRVQDAALVPQTATWTPSVHAALGREYRELNQLDNAIAAYDRVVSTWPTSEVALAARYEAASCWSQIATLEPARAAAARTKAKAGFAAVVTEGSAGSAWYVANAGKAHALTVARSMVESANQKAAP